MNQMIWVFIGIVFAAGVSWGFSWGYAQARKELAETQKNRLSVSMPMHAEDAAATMDLLKRLIERVESENMQRGTR